MCPAVRWWCDSRPPPLARSVCRWVVGGQRALWRCHLSCVGACSGPCSAMVVTVEAGSGRKEAPSVQSDTCMPLLPWPPE